MHVGCMSAAVERADPATRERQRNGEALCIRGAYADGRNVRLPIVHI